MGPEVERLEVGHFVGLLNVYGLTVTTLVKKSSKLGEGKMPLYSSLVRRNTGAASSCRVPMNG
jgi:hypothetical protein